MADFLLGLVNESKENTMNSQVRVVKKQKASESEQTALDSKTSERLRNRERVAVVKSWIDEFKLRNRAAGSTLPVPNRA